MLNLWMVSYLLQIFPFLNFEKVKSMKILRRLGQD